MDGETIPHQTTLRAFCPDTAENSKEHIRKLISGQNEGLRTGGWIVLGVVKELSGTVVTFTVGHKSIQFLKGIKFRVYFKFKVGQFQVKIVGVDQQQTKSTK